MAAQLMFKQMNSLTKATLFYGFALIGTTLVASLASRLPSGDATSLLHMLTPLLAVLLMLLVVTRDGHHKAGWLALGFRGSSLRSIGIAIGGPLLMLGSSYGLIWVTGLGRLVLPLHQTVVNLVLNLAIAIAISSLFAFSEELGFRGYIVPQLLQLGRTKALLLSGLLHGLWHVPLILLTPYYHGTGNLWLILPMFLITLTSAGVFYGDLRLTSNSIWPSTVAHGAFNALWGLCSSITIATTSPLMLEYLAGESGLLPMIGTTVLAIWILYSRNIQAKVVPDTNAVINTPVQTM